jgi:hypothetical protein
MKSLLVLGLERTKLGKNTLATPAGLELELVSNSSSSPKLTLALEVFG